MVVVVCFTYFIQDRGSETVLRKHTKNAERTTEKKLARQTAAAAAAAYIMGGVLVNETLPRARWTRTDRFCLAEP